MPITLTNFTNGGLVTSAEVLDRVVSTENFVNGGTEVGDFANSWITTDLIVRPEFYSSPAPRMQGVSADVHHRQKAGNIEDSVVFFEDLSDRFIPVPGLAVTFHLPESARIYVMCNFQTFEIGANLKTRSPETVFESKLVASCRLFVDSTGIQSTDREVYANTDGSGSSGVSAAGQDTLSRKNHSMVYHHTSTLAAGVHNVSVKMRVEGDTDSDRKFGRIFVTRRNLIVHAQYL